jgi:hypothetical protein
MIEARVIEIDLRKEIIYGCFTIVRSFVAVPSDCNHLPSLVEIAFEIDPDLKETSRIR